LQISSLKGWDICCCGNPGSGQRLHRGVGISTHDSNLLLTFSYLLVLYKYLLIKIEFKGLNLSLILTSRLKIKIRNAGPLSVEARKILRAKNGSKKVSAIFDQKKAWKVSAGKTKYNFFH